MFWAALAVLNLAAGIVMAGQPSRLTDLQTIMRWGRAWLVDGQNVYQLPDAAVQYPPNGIVLLSPLGLLAMSVALPVWLFLNLGMAFLAPYLAARFFRPHDPFRVILLPMLMFLCWGGMRTLTQFSLAALTLAMAALVFADRKPLAGGVTLGLALMKPQVALPVFMWTLYTRRWRLAVIAMTVVAGLFAVFCLWADDSPWRVLARYLGILAVLHTGEAILSGISELRPLIRHVVSDSSIVDAITGAIALGLLAGICAAGFQEGAARKRVLYAAPPLVASWSLLTFYHLTYGFIVLLPVMMLLALNGAEHSILRKTLFWVLQIGMMFDVPGLSRRMGLLGTTSPFVNSLVHADRLLMLLLFAGLIVLARSEPPDAEVRAS
jgi:hypothetical protein